MLLLRRLAALLACVAALVPRATRPLQIPRGGATRPGRALQIPRGGARRRRLLRRARSRPKCTQRDVDKAYRRKSLRCHPDKGGDPEEFKKLNEAREVLSDPAKRKQYDRFGKAGVDGAPGGMPQGNPFAGFSQGGNNAQAQRCSSSGGFGGLRARARSAAWAASGGPSRGASPSPCRWTTASRGGRCPWRSRIASGAALARAGVGEGDVGPARAGDAVVQFELREAPHALYKRRGADLLLDARISLGDAGGGRRSRSRARTVDVPREAGAGGRCIEARRAALRRGRGHARARPPGKPAALPAGPGRVPRRAGPRRGPAARARADSGAAPVVAVFIKRGRRRPVARRAAAGEWKTGAAAAAAVARVRLRVPGVASWPAPPQARRSAVPAGRQVRLREGREVDGVVVAPLAELDGSLARLRRLAQRGGRRRVHDLPAVVQEHLQIPPASGGLEAGTAEPAGAPPDVPRLAGPAVRLLLRDEVEKCSPVHTSTSVSGALSRRRRGRAG